MADAVVVGAAIGAGGALFGSAIGAGTALGIEALGARRTRAARFLDSKREAYANTLNATQQLLFLIPERSAYLPRRRGRAQGMQKSAREAVEQAFRAFDPIEIIAPEPVVRASLHLKALIMKHGLSMMLDDALMDHEEGAELLEQLVHARVALVDAMRDDLQIEGHLP